MKAYMLITVYWMDQIPLWIQTFCLKTILLRYCLIGVALIIKKKVLFQGHALWSNNILNLIELEQ